MRLFLRWVKRSLNVSVQCSHDADASKHRRPIELNDQEQGFDRGFVPVGYLVAGDVMLAQKIALETNELSALAVANRFSPGQPPPNIRPPF